jgi:hypothetical protein
VRITPSLAAATGRLDEAEDRAGVDQDDLKMLLGFVHQPARRLREKMPA